MEVVIGVALLCVELFHLKGSSTSIALLTVLGSIGHFYHSRNRKSEKLMMLY